MLDNQALNAEDQQKMDFGIQRIYVQNLSFEAPNAPLIFRENWDPKVDIDLHNKSSLLEEGFYEVVLSVTCTVKVGEKVAFLAEVQQAGIFVIRNFPDDQLNHLLGSFCPSIIFPYARESITDMVTRGGFPQLYLSPINFDALYQQKLAEENEHQKAQEA